MMENYTLTVLVAQFLGVMGIIAMMERRRRTQISRFAEQNKALSACINSLQQLQRDGEAQNARLAEVLSNIQNAIQASAAASTEATKACFKELQAEAHRTTETVQNLKTSLEETVKF